MGFNWAFSCVCRIYSYFWQFHMYLWTCSKDASLTFLKDFHLPCLSFYNLWFLCNSWTTITGMISIQIVLGMYTYYLTMPFAWIKLYIFRLVNPLQSLLLHTHEASPRGADPGMHFRRQPCLGIARRAFGDHVQQSQVAVRRRGTQGHWTMNSIPPSQCPQQLLNSFLPSNLSNMSNKMLKCGNMARKKIHPCCCNSIMIPIHSSSCIC